MQAFLSGHNDADEIQEGAEGRNQEKVETSIIQSLYNSITDSFVKPPIDKEAQGSHSDSNISTTIPKSQDTDQTSNSAWYSELLGVLESLGATLEHSDTNESKSDSRVSLEELAANESDYMSWLTGAKSKLDEVALQVQNQDWSAFTSFTAEEPEN
ncbi:hypothetical protein LPJ77_003484, partial [Coemansia sp. RSA 2523]